MDFSRDNEPARNRGRKFKAVLSALLMVAGTTLYWLANRYLIEHVEIAGTGSTNIAIAEMIASDTGSASPDSFNENYTADQWHYESDTKSIEIKKVVTGSGQNKITYFVADAVLKDESTLQSAFAKDKYGTNIIQYTSDTAENHDAVLAINGDYYGFRNDGILIRNGVVYRDEGARTGLAIYRDGSMKIYDETQTSAKQLIREGVLQTLSFGPALVVDGQVVTNFGKVEIDTNFGNRSIQDSNPRTGIGMIEPNHYVMVVVDGRSTGYSKGMTLTQFAQVFADLGCTAAYNLDGGGSSEMYFMGRVVNNPLGNNQERGTSDILYI
jgi:exopolysaccharide biosynthesis protein